MAEAAVTCTVTREKENYLRLQLLVVNTGTVIVRGLFNSIHDPFDLPRILRTRRRRLQLLNNCKIIDNKQWETLYPSTTTYGASKDFDLSLLIKLLRNICHLSHPSNPVWNPPLNDTDLSLEADLTRIKWHRNEPLAHPAVMELSDYDFKQYWQEIKRALLRIRRYYSPGDVDEWSCNIDKMLTAPILDEDLRVLQDQYPGIGIAFKIFIPGLSADVDDLALQQYQDKMQQLYDAVQNIFPGAILVQKIYRGSINIQLRVKTVKALEELWRRYQSGELTSALEKVFITDKIRELGECKMTITIPEEQYLDAQAFFDELAQHQANVEVREVTEKLGKLSLDIVHGKTIVVSGNKFQAHLAEITTKEEIDEVIQHMKKDPEYKETKLLVWAYKYYDDNVGRFVYDSDVDDNGEFLAGRRLQKLLEKVAVKNVLIIVTYWEGDVYLHLEVCKHINERALDLLISRGLVKEGILQEDVPAILKKLEKKFEAKKQKAALKAYETVKQATEERRPTDFNIIHSEVITDRKSTFQAHLAPVTSDTQVKQVLEKLKEEPNIAKADSNMFAYRIYVKKKKSYLTDCDDDRENKAGRRLLELLEISKVENVVVIVTRWHGGIHLGTDRFKHINTCASEVIRMARESGLIDGGQQEDPKVESKQKTKGKGKGKHR